MLVVGAKLEPLAIDCRHASLYVRHNRGHVIYFVTNTWSCDYHVTTKRRKRGMSGSKMEPSSRNPGTAASSSRRGESSRDWEEVASALLEDGFFLTALELHAELLESGKELSSLRDYFSNPGNFETAFPQPPTALLGNDLGSHACTCCTDTLTTCNVCLFQHSLWGGVHMTVVLCCALYCAVRTSSMSTFDSIEFGRFSDDSARDNDDRVAGM